MADYEIKVILVNEKENKKNIWNFVDMIKTPVIITTIITSIVAITVAVINSNYQKVETSRLERKAEISFINDMIENGKLEQAIELNLLASYGRVGIPILFAHLLSKENPPNENMRKAIIDNLVRLSTKSNLSEEIGKECHMILLRDPLHQFDLTDHLSALEILSKINYTNAKELLEEYNPTKNIQDFEKKVNEETRPHYMRYLNIARVQAGLKEVQ
jgi:hypothetical protein